MLAAAATWGEGSGPIHAPEARAQPAPEWRTARAFGGMA